MEGLKISGQAIEILENEGQLVVSSRQVAEDFGKRHDSVLRDIENLIEGVGSPQNCGSLFISTTYKHEQNKQHYKEYLLTRDGFSLLVMGFTGSKALKWKLKYIEAFNKMEEHIKEQKQLSPMELLELQFKFSKEVNEKVEKVDNRVTSLEERMTIETGQQKTLCDLVNRRVDNLTGGKDMPAYKELAKKIYSKIWREYKRHFEVASYKDTPIKDFQLGKEFLIKCEIGRDLELMILGANAQMKM